MHGGMEPTWEGDRIINGYSEKQNFRTPGLGGIVFTANYYKGKIN